MATSRRGFFARLAALAAAPFAKKVADAIPNERSRNPAEVLRELADPIADQLGVEVDHESFDAYRDFCTLPLGQSQATGYTSYSTIVMRAEPWQVQLGDSIAYLSENGLVTGRPGEDRLCIGRIVGHSMECRGDGEVEHFATVAVEQPAMPISRKCPWPFKSEPCGYKGPGASCSKTFADCRNPTNYGGTPEWLSGGGRMQPWKDGGHGG